jgi:low temperature requirement protein LtrA
VSEQPAVQPQRVTPLELFFDLVFVFSFTEVTSLLSANPTWSGLGHAFLVLGVLWWAWASYAWFTTTVDAGLGAVSSALLVAMCAMFVAGLAVPQAFGSHGVLFGTAFLIVAVMHVTLYALAARGDADLLAAILRIAPVELIAAVLVAVAGFAGGALRAIIWAAALALAYGVPLLTGNRGFRFQPSHFAERHGLIVIVALGESLVAVGLGGERGGLGGRVILAAVLGFAATASFWLAYFDFFTIRAERLVTDRRGDDRTALARDVYTYLHFPMVAGIVLFAFGAKTTLAHVDDRLAAIPALGLTVGPALFLLGFVVIRLRVGGRLRGGRVAAAIAFVLLWPVALHVPALLALSLVVGVWACLHAYELIWWREARAQTRTLREVSPSG